MGLEWKKYNDLSSLYLCLWKALDVLSDEGRWSETFPMTRQEVNEKLSETYLRDRGKEVGSEIEDREMRALVDRDVSSTINLIHQFWKRPPDEQGHFLQEIDRFKEYLGDQAQRFAAQIQLEKLL